MNRKKTRLALIVAQIVYSLFIFVWLFIAGIFLMGFNSPDVLSEPNTWLMLAYIMIYPLGLLAALIAGWVLFSRQRFKAALIWNSIPLIWIVSLLCIFTFVNFSE